MAHIVLVVKKSLKKAIEELKEESIRVEENLLTHKVKVFYKILNKANKFCYSL